jgi:nicotinamide phosphoribosyltransferase
VLQHNGTLLVRPDSGDQFETVTKTLESLWNTFGGYYNTKDYRVLDNHIRIILGDGCTLFTVRKIWEWMEEHEFAANNVYFGVGAFCFTGIFDNEKLIVNTRDTFGVAEKACAGVTNGKFHFIFKDPKTDTGKLKKSHKGIVWVKYDSNGNLFETDEHTEMLNESASALKTVFKDGVMLNKVTFKEIRNRIMYGKGDINAEH